MYTVANINHWLVSLPSLFTTHPLAVLIPAVVTVFGLFLTPFFLRNSKFRNCTTNNGERKLLFFYFC